MVVRGLGMRTNKSRGKLHEMQMRFKLSKEAKRGGNNRAHETHNPKNPPKSFPTTRQQKVLLVRKLVGGFQGSALFDASQTARGGDP